MTTPTSDDQTIRLKAIVESFLERPEISSYSEARKLIEEIYYQSKKEAQNISSGSWHSEEIVGEKHSANKTKVMQELEYFLAKPSSNERANFLLKQLHLFVK